MDLSKAVWRKASRSHDDGDQCIEVASAIEVIAIRDSKDPNGPKLLVSRGEFLRIAEILKAL